MSRLSNAAILGCLIGIVGLILSASYLAQEIEADTGLGLLFALRGAQRPPSDVVVVSVDRGSAERLNVSPHPDKWPRSLHARLVETLTKRGARAIVFDLYFTEPSSATEDKAFADAMAQARNVVLAGPLQLIEVPSSEGGTPRMPEHKIVKLVEPIAPLSQSAVAVAPFVLPGMPAKVHRYWTFQPSAGDSPTFPVVALQLYTLSVYDEFLRLLEQASPAQAGKLPRDTATAIDVRGVAGLVRDTREMFLSDPMVSAKLREALEHSPLGASNDHDRRLLKSLVEMYGGTDQPYLNYYGPAHTIPTVSFEQALQGHTPSGGDEQVDFANKAVFVGVSRLSSTDREDRYYTVFSRASGPFISGVEIAATAFANLLENAPVKPISSPQYVLVILLWGTFLGVLCHTAGAVVVALGVAGSSLVYLIAAEYMFRSSGTWYPVVVPLLVQAPLAFFGAVLWRYFETNKERQNIRNALAYYVPNEVVQLLARNRIDMKRGGQTVYGVCLFSDAAGYTSVSERMGPQELSEFMHKYFEVVFEPIKENGGLVVALEGDAILAIWKAARPEAALRKQACQAALGVARAVRRFNESLQTLNLPARIGVHAGQIFLGNIGAGGHYAYSATGDTVNTASRMEGLNKHLGTAILVSEDAIRDLDSFLTREAGTFRLKGKTQPIVVHELLCRVEESAVEQRKACALFAEGLRAFRSQAWDEAHAIFSRVIESSGEDGPSTFYMRLCDQHRRTPPEGSWEGTIDLAEK
jgi:adenylate cyclase